MWRIAEAVLHSAVLYREFGVPVNATYSLTISHHGLIDRAFAVSKPTRYLTRPGNVCKVDSSSWSKEITQDLVISGLTELVDEISEDLFVLFNFSEVPKVTITSIVDEFLKSKL